MLAVPSNMNEISPAWLTEALRAGGHIEGASVAGMQSTPIGEGVGFLGELRRIELHYDRPANGAPASLIAKLPTTFPEAREVGMQFRYYERENRFYEDVAPHIGLRIPRAYYIGSDLDAGNFALLLEDLTGVARLGDQLAACDIPTAEMVVRELARFHAAWWNHPMVENLDWMPRVNDPVQLYAGELYQAAWPAFAQIWGDTLPKALLEPGEKLGPAWTAVMDDFATRDQFISHTDFRLDNMLFGEPGSDTELIVIDWQLCVRGGGLYDLGYFVSQSLPVESRRKHERNLIRLYHETLTSAGVTNYPFERCWDDYRIAVLVALVIPVSAAVNTDLSNPRGAAVMKEIMIRSTTAVVDLNAGELLPS